MNLETWTYNGIELEADFEDIEFLEKYSQAMNRLSTRSKEMTKDGKDIDQIKVLCSYYYDFFDDAFGVGTALELFGNKINLRKYEEAFISLVHQNEEVNQQVAKRRMAIKPKNRALRHQND